MCASYWNLNVVVSCPKCGGRYGELQTHFMGGENGTSCADYYALGDRVPALGDTTVKLDGNNDDFIGQCSKCDTFTKFGANIANGAVTDVWILVADASERRPEL